MPQTQTDPQPKRQILRLDLVGQAVCIAAHADRLSLGVSWVEKISILGDPTHLALDGYTNDQILEHIPQREIIEYLESQLEPYRSKAIEAIIDIFNAQDLLAHMELKDVRDYASDQ